MTGPGTNSYLLGRNEIAVLDPGPRDDDHLRSILRAASGPIRWIIVTHTHADHSPLAQELGRQSGAELIGLAPPGDGRQDDSFAPHRSPVDGELLELGESQLRAIHTPGHASNCVCYLLEEAGLLFSGDHILEGVSPVILPPDGSMSEYLKSLDQLAAFDFIRIAPGHGEVIESPRQWIERLRRHRLNREAKLLRVLDDVGSGTVAELTPRVYDDVPSHMHRWAALTLEAHLIKLYEEQRAMSEQGVWRRVLSS